MHQATHTQGQSPDYALTREGFAALRVELAALREKRLNGSDGPTIGEEQIMLDARIASLEEILDHAWTVDPTALARDVVDIGTSVVLRDLDSDRTEEYRVVGKHEPLRPRELSAASAIGRAVLGLTVGQSTVIELPNGHVRRLEVVAAKPVS